MYLYGWPDLLRSAGIPQPRHTMSNSCFTRKEHTLNFLDAQSHPDLMKLGPRENEERDWEGVYSFVCDCLLSNSGFLPDGGSGLGALS